jgi:hypothetical protein
MQLRKSILSVIVITCCLTSHLNSQQKSNNSSHPFSGAVVFSAELGGTFPFTDYSNPELDFFGRGLVEYYFPSKSIHAIGIRFLGGNGYISGEGEKDNRETNYRTTILFLGGGLTYAIKLGNGVPYISAAISYLRFDPRDKDGYYLPNNKQREYDQNAIMYSGELGIRFPFSEVWSLNLGLNLNFTNTDYLDDIVKGSNNDAFATAFVGISLYVGAEKDNDGDGVEDNKDVCPDTPTGLEVGDFGCPIDSDSDGVPDYLDKCNNTPWNILIDETGCPIDSDNDGVTDYFDKCPYTPQNVLVDENGCPERLIAIGADITTNLNKNLTEQNEILIVHGYDGLNEKQVADMFFTDGELYCFQVSSFRDKNVADKEVKNLILDGHNAFVIEAYPFNKYQVWYRVRIGYFNTLAEAKVYKEEYFK